MRGNPKRASKIGKRIRKLREGHRWTQMELAIEAGMHLTHISNLERGMKMPTLDTLIKLADALGVTLDDLASHTPKK